jgi:hypothetical protein
MGLKELMKILVQTGNIAARYASHGGMCASRKDRRNDMIR